MDAYTLLTNRLIESNNGSFVTDLICKPSEEQMQTLIEGSGKPESEIQQVNSSAGLAVNFWKAYELCHPNSKIEFEWKTRIPLKRGFPANIDVVIKDNNTVTFIESKFLEPYYSGNETPRASYLDVSKYSKNNRDNAQSWVALFSQAKIFEVYNVTQLCRHLLAISKDMLICNKWYKNKQVKLCSVIWEMTHSFSDYFPEDIRLYFDSRKELIKKEARKSEILLNDFIERHLDFPNLSFETIKYNDIIDLLKNSPFYQKIKKQYFL